MTYKNLAVSTIIYLVVFFVAGCDSDSTSRSNASGFASRNVNGYILSSVKYYGAFGELLSTTTYLADPTTNTITRSYSNSGFKYVTHYDSNGQFLKRIWINEGEPDSNGDYSSESFINYYTHNSLGLLTKRTRDISFDGSTDSSTTWSYDSSGFVKSRGYDRDNDGAIDTTYNSG